MSDSKNWGETVVGWFIVKDEDQNNPAASADEADLTADELIAKYADQTPLSSDSGEGATTMQTDNFVPSDYKTPPPVENGQVDFVAVFESGGVDAEERERVEKAKSLLDSLPETTDFATKKQIVEASLKAFGVPIEKIIEAGVAEIEALEFYIRSGKTDTEKLLKESTERIQNYEQEIKNLRNIMEQRVAEQNTVVAACNAKKLETQKILEFFGRETVAQVVKDSPKLHEPEKVEEV
jgi:Pyruvate/2-oxoacid:ferredoxin oxidoreductase gamma subunit